MLITNASQMRFYNVHTNMFSRVIVGKQISILSTAMLAMAFSPYNIGNEEEFGC